MSAFQGGEIHWSQQTDAHVVRGAILAKWKQAGGAAGYLGFPTSDDAPTAGKDGYVTDFSGGSIYWSAATKEAHIVKTAVNRLYQNAGGTTSRYGYPVSDTTTTADGHETVHFANGEDLTA
jgi:uncharacterized protein with LGFP repeats